MPLKIEINNFGPIHKQEFDLGKDCYLIYGKNNLGKSYGIDLAYLAIKHFLEFDEKSLPLYLKLLANSEITFSEAPTKKTLVSDIKKALKQILNAFFSAGLGQSLLASFFSIRNLHDKYGTGKTSIKFKSNWLEFKISVYGNSIMAVGIDLPFAIDLAREGSEYIILVPALGVASSFSLENRSSYQMAVGSVCLNIIGKFYQNLRKKINSVHFWPASRSGLYQILSSFGVIVASLARVRSAAGDRMNLPPIPEQMADYFIELTSITRDSP